MPKINNVIRQEIWYVFAIMFLRDFIRERNDILTVYADVAFIINFIYDLELLVLLCKVFSKKVPKMRVFLSAFMGGLLGVFAFLPYLEVLTRPAARFVFPVFYVYMVFKPLGVKDFVNRYLCFVSISFIMSGAITYLGLGVFSGILIPGVIYFLFIVLRKNVIKKKRDVILEYKGKRVMTEGFYDSGNMLLSGGLPVILGNSRIFEKLLDCKVSYENICSLSEKFEMRIIPFISLGKSGTIIGIKLNRIWVDGKKYDDIVLAFAGNKFADELILNSIMT